MKLEGLGTRLQAVQVGTSSLPTTYLDLSVCRDGVVVFGGEQSNDSHRVEVVRFITLLKMGRYYNTTLCHYWDMSVK